MPVNRHIIRRVFVMQLAAVLVAGCGRHTTASAQVLSPYSDFQAMTAGEMATLEVKLTDVATLAGSPNPSVLIGGSQAALNMGLFAPFRRSGYVYDIDDVRPRTSLASASELRALIDSVAALPGVTDGGVDSSGHVSFSLLNTAGGSTKVFEAILDTVNAPALFGKMLTVMRSNAPSTRALRSFGCNAAALPSGEPNDVHTSVTIVAGGLRADRRAASHFVGTVRITNSSGSSLPAPLLLVAVCHADLIGADGVSCNIAPSGNPFIYLLTTGSLAPGASIEKAVTFVDASGERPAITYRVFAGAGTP